MAPLKRSIAKFEKNLETKRDVNKGPRDCNMKSAAVLGEIKTAIGETKKIASQCNEERNCGVKNL